MENTQSAPKPVKKAKSPWLLALVVTGAVFLCGVAVGAIVTQGFLFQRTMKGFGKRGFRSDGAIKQIQRDLDLTDEQASKLQKLFKEHEKNMDAIHKDIRPRLDAEFESFRSKVEAILTPEQAKRWNKHFRNKMAEMLPPPPPGPKGMNAPRPHGLKGMPAPHPSGSPVPPPQ